LKKTPPGYDEAVGHLAVQRGSLDLPRTNWAALLGEPHQSLDKAIGEKHLLNGIEGTDVDFEIYLIRDRLRLHTDLTLFPCMVTLGLILACDEGACITTGRSNITVSPGDLYRLDPNKMHGAHGYEFLAFISYDYRQGHEPEPAKFRHEALRAFMVVARKRGAIARS